MHTLAFTSVRPNPQITQQISKMISIVLSGALISFALFVTMELLVRAPDAPIEQMTYVPIGPIVMPKPETKVITKPVKLPPPPALKVPPLPPKNIADPVNAIGNPTLTVQTPVIEPSIGNTITFTGQGNTQATPIVRIDPKYPAIAARDGIEGWVKLSFDISPTGEVINVKVLESEPRRIFDRSAAKALAGWKYKPQFVDGQAKIQSGLSVKLDFTLAK
ncbi:TonB family protein [Catenovulum sp. SX2]|uniref:energy transducer TonB n=1 Tax=Catenovulum sp. SX2 TaxID=3398614 RepID=UPI003F838616